MPLKYYCPKCDKRFVDWGAEKLGFKCPDCANEALFKVGTGPNGDADGAPSLSKSAAKRKAKPRPKTSSESAEFDEDISASIGGDDSEGIDDDISGLDDDDDSDVIGDSLAIDED